MLIAKVALTSSLKWRHVSLTLAIIKDYSERGMEEGWGSEERWGLESKSNTSAPNESYSHHNMCWKTYMARFFDIIVSLQRDYLLGGVTTPHTPRYFRPCRWNLQWNAGWNVVDLNVLEIPGNPEILDNNFRKSGDLSQICTKSRNPGQFFLGFPKSGKSRTLFWVVICPSMKSPSNS